MAQELQPHVVQWCRYMKHRAYLAALNNLFSQNLFNLFK